MVQQQPLSISPKDAYQLLDEHPNALLIDVRSTMEYLFVGHPVGAIHIAWIDEPKWEVNPHFVTEIRKLVLGGVCGDEKSHPGIILICRSGKRSLEAGQHLIDAGFDNIYNINTGFEGERNEKHQRSTLGGWRFDGLPWEQC